MTVLDHAALTLQVASCFFMTGVILLIQLIHYPSFYQIEKNQFMRFHFQHSRALGFIAGPTMVIELSSALWMARTGDFKVVLNGVSVIALWAITFLISVPAHHRLSRGFDEKQWLHLMKTNWLRTFLWVGRSLAFLFWLLAKELTTFFCQNLKA